MSYIFDPRTAKTNERQINDLKFDVKRFRKACRSEWARPIDYVNLIDALFRLEALEADIAESFG